VANRLTSHSHGARERFVEIVNIEDHPSFWSSEGSKIHQMRVTAGLDPDPRGRRVSQIGCHDCRRTSVKDKGRGNHPSITDGNQLWKPSLVGCLQDFDRVCAVTWRLPPGMTIPQAGIPNRLALCVLLLSRRPPLHYGRARRPIPFTSKTFILAINLKFFQPVADISSLLYSLLAEKRRASVWPSPD
jgi:hypothetical protein